MRIIHLLLALVCISAYSQEFKLGKVSKQELEEKFHPADSSAAAAILYKRGDTYFMVDGTGNWTMVTTVETRIKIYSKEGYDNATQEITYYTGGRSIKAYFDDAKTYNLVNGEIEVTKLKSDGEFKEKVTDDFSQKKITMPNVKEGSVIEFSYTVETPYFTNIRDWYFQYEIPANFVQYNVATPEYFSYNRYMSGYIKVDQTAPVLQYGKGGRFQEVKVSFTAKNVKALKNESYVNNVDNYLSILKYELASTHFTSGTENYSTDWPTVAKKIYENTDFGKELEYTSYFKDDIAVLVNKSAPHDEKLATVFNYVKSHMAWDGDAAYYCKKGVKRAYEDKVGNTAEINLMLTAMLREAGINANPVLVSTRSNGIALYPTRTAYDYVIAGVETDKGVVLLDATSKYTLPDILPMRALNWVGRMIRKNGTTSEIDLMPKKTSKEVMNISAAMDAEGVISGKVKDMSQDYNAYSFRERYAGLSTEIYSQKLEERYNGIEVNDFKAEHKDLAKPVVEEFSFRHRNLCDIIGDKIYFSPILFFSKTENPFKAETREYPVDFMYPYQHKFLITIAIPQGYVVESLPESFSVAMEQNIGTFKYNLGQNNGTIQLAAVFEINYSNVSQEYYKTLKEFYQKVIEKQTEKIVLKKA